MNHVDELTLCVPSDSQIFTHQLAARCINVSFRNDLDFVTGDKFSSVQVLRFQNCDAKVSIDLDWMPQLQDLTVTDSRSLVLISSTARHLRRGFFMAADLQISAGITISTLSCCPEHPYHSVVTDIVEFAFRYGPAASIVALRNALLLPSHIRVRVNRFSLRGIDDIEITTFILQRSIWSNVFDARREDFLQLAIDSQNEQLLLDVIQKFHSNVIAIDSARTAEGREFLDRMRLKHQLRSR